MSRLDVMHSTGQAERVGRLGARSGAKGGGRSHCWRSESVAANSEQDVGASAKFSKCGKQYFILGPELKQSIMGQQLSSQTQTVINKLPEKVVKHVSLVRESGFLTYEEFLGRVAELNDTTAQLASGQNKHLLFEVQPGSDATALWKVAVRIVCTKINKTSGNVEVSRIMNLYQFIQLYKDITSQASQVLSQNAPSEGIAEDLSSVESCQASLWMGRVKQLTDEEECCICMDGRADLILPCAHSFCQKCIDKWSGRHRNCPVCRLQVTAANDSWVVSEAPTEEDIATYILNLVDEAGQPHIP